MIVSASFLDGGRKKTQLAKTMLPDKQSLVGGIGHVQAFYIPWQLYLN